MVPGTMKAVPGRFPAHLFFSLLLSRALLHGIQLLHEPPSSLRRHLHRRFGDRPPVVLLIVVDLIVRHPRRAE